MDRTQVQLGLARRDLLLQAPALREAEEGGSAATLAAFCRAVRTTLAGSMMPALTMSQNSLLRASKP